MSRVLLVDDNPALADLTRMWLERGGYTVQRAFDGPEGFEVLRRIRADERTRGLPVVMITTFSRDKDQGRGLGANDYLVKPLMESEFLRRIRRFVTR